MIGAVFYEVMRRSLTPLLFWGASAGVLGWAIVIIVPSVESLQQMAKLIETFPPALLQAFGGDDVKFLASPEGYLSLNFYSWIMIVLAAYSILAGLAVTANEEEQGSLDVLISLPIPRWRILLEKTLAYSVIIVGNAILTLVGVAIGVAQTPSMSISLTRVAEATLNMIPGMLFMLAFTVLVCTLARRRNVAAGIAGGYLVISYFLDLVGRAAKGTILEQLRVLSFYTYHDNPGVMLKGLAWGNVIGLLAVSIIMIGVALWAFEQRDVGV